MPGKPLDRYPDWEQRLEAALQRLQRPVFGWGRHDCCLATSELIRAMTGYDAMLRFRGRYRDQATAAKLIDSIGGLAKELSRQFGSPVQPVQARRGDLVLVKQDTHTLGLCLGSTAICCDSERGWVNVPRRDWRLAWRVG